MGLEATPTNPPPTLPTMQYRGGSLSLKTTIFLLVLMTSAIAIGGFIFLRATHNMILNTERNHAYKTSTDIAQVLSNPISGPQDQIPHFLPDLAVMNDLEFVAFTNSDMHLIASFKRNSSIWQNYSQMLLQSPHALTSQVGLVTTLSGNGNPDIYYVIQPIWKSHPGKNGKHDLLGYLHIGVPTNQLATGTHTLETTIFASCLIMALAAIPTAVLASRHLTVPIHKLAHAAQNLAEGHLFARVQIRRTDELGGLAEAFNSMAEKLQQQHLRLETIHDELEATVEQRTSQLHQTNVRLEAEMAEKEDFLRAVSHDLNAPIRNIGGLVAMLLLKHGKSLDPDAIQRLERIQKNVETESELINELLELSRIRSRRERIEEVDLNQMVESLADQFSGDLEHKGITLEIATHLPTMFCERLRLRQVFMNLLDNAIKYMRLDDPKHIKIECFADPDEMRFVVSDTGLGIAPEDLPNIFHVFRRAKSAAVAQIPGKGVGLASVKAIVENYGGKLEVHSKLNEGTQFSFTFPLKHFQPRNHPEVAA